MPKTIRGKPHYSAQEAAKASGISKATLLRWIGSGVVKDARRRDRNNWRWFDEAEVRRIRRVAAREQ